MLFIYIGSKCSNVDTNATLPVPIISECNLTDVSPMVHPLLVACQEVFVTTQNSTFFSRQQCLSNISKTFGEECIVQILFELSLNGTLVNNLLAEYMAITFINDSNRNVPQLINSFMFNCVEEREDGEEDDSIENDNNETRVDYCGEQLIRLCLFPVIEELYVSRCINQLYCLCLNVNDSAENFTNCVDKAEAFIINTINRQCQAKKMFDCVRLFAFLMNGGL